MKRDNRWRAWLPWLAVLAWYGLIFWFSSQNGDASQAQSDRVAAITRTDGEWFPVRKQAHMGLYFVLGALVCIAWRLYGLTGWKLAGYTLVTCAALGGLDELHQLFVAERSAQVADVAIDTAGSALGMLGTMIVDRRWRRRGTKG